MIPPHVVCRWLGHDRETYAAGFYLDRHGRHRTKFYSRCKRCGTSDGGEVFNEGIFERFRWRRIRKAAWRFRRSFGLWAYDKCGECGKTQTICGRHVGDHSNCNEIPF